MSRLNSHPQIFCPKLPTLFSKRNLSPIKSFKPKFLQVDNPISPYYRYRSQSFQRRLAHHFKRSKLIHAFLTDMYASDNSEIVVGHKINYSQIRKHKAVYSWIQRNDVKIIHLIRYNLLKRLVSHQIANTRNLLHSKRSVSPIKVRVDPQILIEDFQRRRKRFARYRERFTGDLKVPYIEVVYESLLRQHDSEIRKALKFLNVRADIPLTSDFVKVNPDSLEDIIENISEIRAVLHNTEFESYL